MRDPYVKPTTQELFDFVRFYTEWYLDPSGISRTRTAVRAENAATAVQHRDEGQSPQRP